MVYPGIFVGYLKTECIILLFDRVLYTYVLSTAGRIEFFHVLVDFD